MSQRTDLLALAEAFEELSGAYETAASRYRERHGSGDGFSDWDNAIDFGHREGKSYLAGWMKHLVRSMADAADPIQAIRDALHEEAESIGGDYECRDCGDCWPLGKLIASYEYPNDLYCHNCAPYEARVEWEFYNSEYGQLAVQLGAVMSKTYDDEDELIEKVYEACAKVTAENAAA